MQLPSNIIVSIIFYLLKIYLQPYEDFLRFKVPRLKAQSSKGFGMRARNCTGPSSGTSVVKNLEESRSRAQAVIPARLSECSPSPNPGF